ncbi:hypothetical protein ABT56_16315 [Photobacterium aquae]|uniref:Uncharacterized protein n=1 Tax=Photobacterium aquae TaxID=1195763 RepID=A0A0J1GWV5_9GAMM|nr:tetratricopeptide repeat protein [Photobacterium aquae]KLV04170.1 hypothetical protein ABT56_16315 [Photobacterium aquae]
MKKNQFVIATMVVALLSACSSTVVPTTTVTDMTKLGNTQGVIEYYKQQLVTHSDDESIMIKLADAYFKSGDVESASFYVHHVLEKNPRIENAQLYVLLGDIYSRQMQYQKALSAFDRAYVSGDASADLHIRRGMAYTELKQYSDAEDEFNAARLNGGDDLTIKNNLAVLMLAQGQYKSAVEMLMPVYRQNPNNQTLNVNLAIALIKAGNKDTAIDVLKTMYGHEDLNKLVLQVQQMGQ